LVINYIVVEKRNIEYNRIKDRIENLYSLEIIDETNRDKKNGGKLKIIKKFFVDSLLKNFSISTR